MVVAVVGMKVVVVVVVVVAVVAAVVVVVVIGEGKDGGMNNFCSFSCYYQPEIEVNKIYFFATTKSTSRKTTKIVR